MSAFDGMSAKSILLGAGALGAVLGVGSVVMSPEGRAAVATNARDVAVATGVKRAREPQAGDHWGGCDSARAAGTAPIFRGEPGYRPEMDGDDDGIACEPPRR